jgi:hypothetical protein
LRERRGLLGRAAPRWRETRGRMREGGARWNEGRASPGEGQVWLCDGEECARTPGYG